MVLSDREITDSIENGNVEIEPYNSTNIGPSSIDLRLGDSFKKATISSDKIISLHDETDSRDWHELSGSVTLYPGNFVLATTKETVSIPNTLVAHVLGRSSLGRLGVSVHQTAGYIDPGFTGQITLELSNHGPTPVKLHANDRVCQMVIERLSTPARNPYGDESAQYDGQSGPTKSGMQFD